MAFGFIFPLKTVHYAVKTIPQWNNDEYYEGKYHQVMHVSLASRGSAYILLGSMNFGNSTMVRRRKGESPE